MSIELLSGPPVPAGTTSGRIALDRSAGAARLLVDGSPFYVRGVELHNSTPSGATALAHGLDVACAVHANTVLASVTWEAVEPEEGAFDFSTVSRLLAAARDRGLRLVLLWFGAWKNGASSYAPGWVKRDWQRFPRCVLEDGRLSDTLSPFGPTPLDLEAFTALVRFVEDVDAVERTVIMVQVENEMGLLGSSRDHCAAAQARFGQPVPAPLRSALATRPGFEPSRRPLAWADVQADPLGRDEAFMAWGYASHVEALARAARTWSATPLFVNAWLDSEIDIDLPDFAVAGGQVPGTYPSGGPLPRVADVWTSVAVSVDLFAPDVYFGDAGEICSAFSTMSGGLFIPEQRRDDVGVGDAFLAWGEHAAIGVAPFGVDSATAEELEPLADAYLLLATATPLLTRPDGSRAPSRGFHLDDAVPGRSLALGDTVVEVSRALSIGGDSTGSRGYGLVVDLGDDGYALVGRGFHARFTSADPAWQVCLETVRELSTDGARADVRVLNGDETASGAAVVHPPRTRRTSTFPIPLGHAHTGASTCRTYRLPSTAP